MNFAQVGVDLSREDELIFTKKRLETFQFRRTNVQMSPTPPLSPASSFGQPQSRHGSVSSSSSSLSTNSGLLSLDRSSFSSFDSRPQSFVGRPKTTSHHRRHSSVSTRAESAEIMGITLPELPISSSDDNINFGDKDSVRRRALQALEGRGDLGSCSKTVEIPEFSSQGTPQRPFDRELKLPTTGPPYGIPSLPGKRDSFGKPLPSANSLKDQLHTLMEEEEEEEEEEIEEKFTETIAPGDEHIRESSPKPLVSDHERRRTKGYGIFAFFTHFCFPSFHH